MVFVIHWHESAMDLHVFPILIPPPTSLSISYMQNRKRDTDVHFFLMRLLSAGFRELQQDCSNNVCSFCASILAWRIPGMEEPGGLPTMASHRVRHDWSDLAVAAAAIFWNAWCENSLTGLKIISILKQEISKFHLLRDWKENVFDSLNVNSSLMSWCKESASQGYVQIQISHLKKLESILFGSTINTFLVLNYAFLL